MSNGKERLDTLRTDGAPGRTRTDTGRILSPLSLPLDYGGESSESSLLGVKSRFEHTSNPCIQPGNQNVYPFCIHAKSQHL